MLIVTVTGASMLPLGSVTVERSTVQKTESPVSCEICAAVPMIFSVSVFVESSASIPSGTLMTLMSVSYTHLTLPTKA